VKAASTDVSLDDIYPEGNIREFAGDSQEMRDLVTSVASVGVLEPILITPRKGTPKYQLLAGFRRYSAACAAGLQTIPARVITDVTAAQTTEIRLTENLHRLNMNPMEEAAGVTRYLEETGLTQQQAARRLGRSDAWISMRVRFLEFPPAVQELLRAGQLGTGNAYHLLPFIGKASDVWITQAAKVGVYSTAFPRFLEEFSTHPGGFDRRVTPRARASAECGCPCKCCTSRGSHLPPLGGAT
jgi:ParB family transcriptional regulator, chromosome partitioning protein